MSEEAPKVSKDVVRQIMEIIPFNRTLGLALDELGPGSARMSIPFREDLIGDPLRRAIHGGVISALIDTCGGAALWSECEPGDRLSTVDLRVDYLRPGRCEDLICVGKVVRLGNRVGVTEMVVFHEGREEAPIASGKAVYNVKRGAN